MNIDPSIIENLTKNNPHLKNRGLSDQLHILPTSSREFSSEKITALTRPKWGDAFLSGLKTAGVALGALFLGALSIGLLPFTITGGVLFHLGKIGEMNEGIMTGEDTFFEGKGRRFENENLLIAGALLAAPAFGCIACVSSIIRGSDEMAAFKKMVSKWISNPEKAKKSLPQFKIQAKNIPTNELIRMRKHVQTVMKNNPYNTDLKILDHLILDTLDKKKSND